MEAVCKQQVEKYSGMNTKMYKSKNTWPDTHEHEDHKGNAPVKQLSNEFNQEQDSSTIKVQLKEIVDQQLHESTAYQMN